MAPARLTRQDLFWLAVCLPLRQFVQTGLQFVIAPPQAQA